jgi:hypothetical protein
MQEIQQSIREENGVLACVVRNVIQVRQRCLMRKACECASIRILEGQRQYLSTVLDGVVAHLRRKKILLVC